jgi:hypothetical protein
MPRALSNWGKELVMGPLPAHWTGWKTVGKGTPDRRDYCEQHADLADS